MHELTPAHETGPTHSVVRRSCDCWKYCTCSQKLMFEFRPALRMACKWARRVRTSPILPAEFSWPGNLRSNSHLARYTDVVSVRPHGHHLAVSSRPLSHATDEKMPATASNGPELMRMPPHALASEGRVFTGTNSNNEHTEIQTVSIQ